MKTKKATFASGCFWGVEKVFSAQAGVLSTSVGYTGGTTQNPSYEAVCTGRTGHAEAIEIEFDPSKLSYQKLVEIFFIHHDPTTLNRQGNDRGTQYRSAIFYHTLEQKKIAEACIKAILDAKIYQTPVVTQIEKAQTFYHAEEYHQKYLKKNPNGYCHLNLQSGKVAQILSKLNIS